MILKLNNKQRADLLLYMHAAIIILLLSLLMIAGYFLPHLISYPYRIAIILFMGAFLLSTTYKLLKINYIDFENSGEILSIREHSPYSRWFLRREKRFEMPLKDISGFEIQNKKLIILLHSNKCNTQHVRIYYTLRGVTNQQVDLIKKSLEKN